MGSTGWFPCFVVVCMHIHCWFAIRGAYRMSLCLFLIPPFLTPPPFSPIPSVCSRPGLDVLWGAGPGGPLWVRHLPTGRLQPRPPLLCRPLLHLHHYLCRCLVVDVPPVRSADAVCPTPNCCDLVAAAAVVVMGSAIFWRPGGDADRRSFLSLFPSFDRLPMSCIAKECVGDGM